jgi:hypothetical protein
MYRSYVVNNTHVPTNHARQGYHSQAANILFPTPSSSRYTSPKAEK